MENMFDFFLLKLSVTNLKERFVRVHKVLWKLCCKSCGRYRINSLVPKRLLKTRIFEKERKLSSEKRFLAYLSLALSSTKNVEEKLIRANKVFWQVLCKLYERFFGT